MRRVDAEYRGRVRFLWQERPEVLEKGDMAAVALTLIVAGDAGYQASEPGPADYPIGDRSATMVRELAFGFAPFLQQITGLFLVAQLHLLVDVNRCM